MSSGVIKLVAACSSLCNLLLGYDIGIMSVAHVYIQRQMNLSDFEDGLQVGCLNFAGAIGGIMTGFLADRYGRRGTLIVAAILFLIGAGLTASAPHFSMLFIGRIITGLGTGIGALCPALLLAELVPKRLRGSLVGYTEVMNNVGIFLGFLIGYLMCGLPPEWNWRLMLALGVVPPFVIIATLGLIPESPRWFAMQGRLEDAKASIEKIAEPEERDSMTDDVREGLLQEVAPWSEILCPGALLRSIILVGWGVPVLSQATGTEAVVYFTPDILMKAGINSEVEAFKMNILVGFVKSSLLIIPMLYVDSVGRRPVLFFAVAGQGISSLFLATVLGIPHAPSYLPLLGLLSFIATFSLGLSTLAFVIPTEVFPLRYRARCTGVGWFLNRITSSLVAITFLPFSDWIGQSGVFYFYSAIAWIGLVYMYLLMPETSNMSLEETEGLFKQAVSHGSLDDKAKQPAM